MNFHRFLLHNREIYGKYKSLRDSFKEVEARSVGPGTTKSQIKLIENFTEKLKENTATFLFRTK